MKLLLFLFIHSNVQLKYKLLCFCFVLFEDYGLDYFDGVLEEGPVCFFFQDQTDTGEIRKIRKGQSEVIEEQIAN